MADEVIQYQTEDGVTVIRLQARDGRLSTFVRRKGRREDLFDDQDQPQPESASIARHPASTSGSLALRAGA